MEKWKKAEKEERQTREAFDQLGERLPPDLKIKWKEEEQYALEQGGDHMAVYGVKLEEGE